MDQNEESTPQRSVERAFSLEDMHVRSDGSGRVVEAYAAVFNTQTEVYDQDGHYHEQLASNSFTRTLAHRGLNFGVLFNHARTVDGAPNPAATMPIGVPLEIRADERGLWTATKYLDNPMADWVLDAIKHRAIRAQSFSGRFIRSTRTRPQSRASGGGLPLITRHEVAMREYGPAVFAAYEGAEILGTRAADMFVRSLLAVPPGERVEWLQQFEGGSTLIDPETSSGTPTGRAGLTDDSRSSHSQSDEIRSRIAALREKLPKKE